MRSLRPMQTPAVVVPEPARSFVYECMTKSGRSIGSGRVSTGCRIGVPTVASQITVSPASWATRQMPGTSST